MFISFGGMFYNLICVLYLKIILFVALKFLNCYYILLDFIFKLMFSAFVPVTGIK